LLCRRFCRFSINRTAQTEKDKLNSRVADLDPNGIRDHLGCWIRIQICLLGIRIQVYFLGYLVPVLVTWHDESSPPCSPPCRRVADTSRHLCGWPSSYCLISFSPCGFPPVLLFAYFFFTYITFSLCISLIFASALAYWSFLVALLSQLFNVTIILFEGDGWLSEGDGWLSEGDVWLRREMGG
jgi:hypothetical protein